MLMVTTFVTWNFTRNFNGHSLTNLSSTLRRELLHNSLNSVVNGLTEAYSLSLTLSAMHQHSLVVHGGNHTWNNAINDEVFGFSIAYLLLCFILNVYHVVDISLRFLIGRSKVSIGDSSRPRVIFILLHLSIAMGK